MSHQPINLTEFTLEDILSPWNPDNDRLTIRDRDASSRMLSCPSLIHYLLKETLEGRSSMVGGKDEYVHHVSDLAAAALESQVLSLGGKSFTEAWQTKSMVGPKTYMLHGSYIIRFIPFAQTNIGGETVPRYSRGIANAVHHESAEAAATAYEHAVANLVDLELLPESKQEHQTELVT